jgi:hypothetical protein
MQPVPATCEFFYKFSLVFNLWQGLESILEGIMPHSIRQFSFVKSNFVATKKTFVFVSFCQDHRRGKQNSEYRDDLSYGSLRKT